MRSWDVKGWNTGVKIRRRSWKKDNFVQYSSVNGGHWIAAPDLISKDREYYSWANLYESLLNSKDWEIAE